MKDLDKKCRVCGLTSEIFSQEKIFNHDIQYLECKSCGYVQTEEPYWLKKAYEDAINISDTGIMSRNQANTKIVAVTLLLLGKLQGIVVDAAGGY